MKCKHLTGNCSAKQLLSLSLYVSLCGSRTYTHILSRFPSQTHTHTHTHTCRLSSSLFLFSLCMFHGELEGVIISLVFNALSQASAAFFRCLHKALQDTGTQYPKQRLHREWRKVTWSVNQLAIPIHRWLWILPGKSEHFKKKTQKVSEPLPRKVLSGVGSEHDRMGLNTEASLTWVKKE